MNLNLLLRCLQIVISVASSLACLSLDEFEPYFSFQEFILES